MKKRFYIDDSGNLVINSVNGSLKFNDAAASLALEDACMTDGVIYTSKDGVLINRRLFKRILMEYLTRTASGATCGGC